MLNSERKLTLLPLKKEAWKLNFQASFRYKPAYRNALS
jgi:hypothetical protein